MRRALALVALAPALAAAERPADLEMGARLGARLNLGGLGNGGAQIGGAFLYRLSEWVWFDTQAHVSVGGSAKHCYLGRDRDVVCDPSLASGAGVLLLGGPRWFLPPVGNLTPHAGAGLGLGYASFTADDLAGVALPAWIGGGARARVAPGVSVGGELVVTGGPARFSRDQRWGPFLSLSILGSVDFGL
jgi:hypothetical protein